MIAGRPDWASVSMAPSHLPAAAAELFMQTTPTSPTATHGELQTASYSLLLSAFPSLSDAARAGCSLKATNAPLARARLPLSLKK